MSKQEKRRLYNEPVLHVNHKTFTPLLLSIYGSTGRECNMSYSKLPQLKSEKRNLSKSITMNYQIRSKFRFARLKLSLLCLQGSRMVCRKVLDLERDTDVSHEHGKN